MKNSEYWKKRFELLEQSQNQQGLDCYADLEKQYREAQKQIEGQISVWYQRFADNNGVSMADARKMLTSKELAELKWDINQYIQYGEENAINGTWVKQLENASARYHISRLEALKLQTQQSIEVLFGNQLDSIDSAMRGIYTSGYYHTAYEIQKGVGVGWDFATLDDKTISKVINKPWAVDGKNFSERIWGNRQKLVNELNTELTRNIILGQDPQKAIDAIAKKMNTSKVNAGRLVMTEEAFFSSAAQKDCFAELDVEQFEIVATLDSHTSEICQGMDGQHFPMSQWEIGVTAPPFHVNCRSTTVPYFGDEFDNIGERAARDEEGNTYYVPADMTYKDWQKSFVDGDKSALQKVKSDDTMKVKDELMKGLPKLSEVKTNDDIKAFAEQFIDNLGIDCSNIQINVKGALDFGHCTLGSGTTQSVIHYNEYVLNGNDERSMTHRVKTAFHESFHLSAEGREWDGLTSAYKIKEPWRRLEETFTESSAHYLLERYGVTEKIAPSYAKELVTNLPRLKQLDKYSSCSTIQDFGKIAFTDRQNGSGAMWMGLSKQMNRVKLADDYYTQYYSYINEHEDELFDMFLANMPKFGSYREQMKSELKSAMNKSLLLLNDNEQTVYYGIMSCAMQKVGVK
jgi:SPP1 gp7 family putative phage head morphogenesis protein